MTARWKSAAGLLLGAVATLPFSFDGFALKPVLPLTLAALLVLADGERPKAAAWLGWIFGFGFFTAGVYWVYVSTHIYGNAPWWLSLIMAGLLFWFLALYFALAIGVSVRMNWLRNGAGWIGLPALWILTELLRGWIWSGFPWLSLGYAAVDTPWTQAAPLVGVTGLSGLIVLLALALFRALVTRGALRLRAVAIAALLLVAPLLAPAPEHWSAAQGEALDVAIIQGNILQDQKWLPEMQQPTLQRYRDMTLASADADLVVWPEVALTYRWEDAREPFLAPLAAQVAANGGALLTGIVAGNPSGRGVYNSLVALGAAQGRYDKRHLVPFGEFFPIPDFLKPVMRMLGTPYDSFLFGADEQPPILFRGERLGVSICFEDAFPNEIRRIASGSTVLVNVTNDAWFGNSPAAHQHLHIARMRAIETGRMIVRAANTGISALIGADGNLAARSEQFTTQVLRGKVQPRAGMTPYDGYGDVPLWIGSALIVLALLPSPLRGWGRGRG
jgi:apolipoprotein N-acyltransferase